MSDQNLVPACALLALCVDCGQSIELPLPLDQRALALHLAQHAWFPSVMSPPDQAASKVILGPLCGACAQQVLPPEVFKEAEARRQQLLQSAQR